MKKPERDWFIHAADNHTVELTVQRRAYLARKGQLLFKKYCNLNGNGICAESFAEYHMLRNEQLVVDDFLDFLRDTLILESDSNKIKITQALIERIETLWSEPMLTE